VTAISERNVAIIFHAAIAVGATLAKIYGTNNTVGRNVG
jgi:hypothetical protein